MAVVEDDNKLDFVAGVRLLPWDWRNLGAAFCDGRSDHNQSVSARCSFVVRRDGDGGGGGGGGVGGSGGARALIEGTGALGLNIRAGGLAFHIGASDLAYVAGGGAGLDGSGGGGWGGGWASGVGSPAGALGGAAADAGPGSAAAAAAGGPPLPRVRVSAAAEFAPDSYAAVSYDLAARRPELALAWSGETPTERGVLSLHVDPAARAAVLRAAVSFPGPEWREDVYDEVTSRVEAPRDDGGRHALWVEHAAAAGAPLAATRLGGSLDLGRLVNWAADFVDYRLEPRIPPLVWKIPLSQRLYNFLVPPEDSEQARHKLSGLSLEFAQDFARAAPALGLSQRLPGGARAVGMYDPEARAASLRLRAGGLSAGVALARADGSGWREWGAPSFSLAIEPLAFL